MYFLKLMKKEDAKYVMHRTMMMPLKAFNYGIFNYPLIENGILLLAFYGNLHNFSIKTDCIGVLLFGISLLLTPLVFFSLPRAKLTLDGLLR